MKRSNGHRKNKATREDKKEQFKRIKNALTSSLKLDERCIECDQLLRDVVLKQQIDDRELEKWSDELQVLTHPKLLVLQDVTADALSTPPQHRITSFSVFGKCGHLIPIDAGLIEQGKDVFMRGLVRPLLEDGESTFEGQPVDMVGPISEWWFSGFDGSEKILLGLESAYASYILDQPSHFYKPFVEKITDKLFLSKLVIEFLNRSPDATFEELLEIIRERSCGRFDEESLMRHSNFIAQQIMSYDEAADDDEQRLMETTAMTDFLALCGVTKPNDSGGKIARKDARRLCNSDALATSTPLVRRFFDDLFREVIETKTKGAKDELNKKKPGKRQKTSQNKLSVIRWKGDKTFDVLSERTCYTTLQIDTSTYSNGDFIAFHCSSSDRTAYGQIKCMYETRNRSKHLHVQIFTCGTETILGSTAMSRHLYMVFECENIVPSQMLNKISVKEGNAEPYVILKEDEDMSAFKCDKIYCPLTGSFQDIPPETLYERHCLSCDKNSEERFKFGPQGSGEEGYSFVNFCGKRIACNDFVLLSLEAYAMPDHYLEHLKNSVNCSAPEEDYNDIYSERYRRSLTDTIKGSLADVSSPYLVGRVHEMFAIDASKSTINLKVRKLFRPENVFSELKKIEESDLCELFYSDDFANVSLEKVVCSCTVERYSSHDNDVSYYSDRRSFFVRSSYDHTSGTLTELSDSVVLSEKREGTIEKKKKLKTLDLFAGCGGLAMGFELAGASCSSWAIEKDKSAADSFKLNFPEATVFTDDANHLLKQVLAGDVRNGRGQKLPARGDIDLILAGPPCQGFSGMNRFSSGQYSLFKNSLIVTLLSYVDYYRPGFVVIENVRNLFKFKKCMILKLTLSCLLRMNYQVRFGVLQAGFYGVPQARKRALIIAAAPGKVLPEFPQPLTCFAMRCAQLWTIVDDKKYFTNLAVNGHYRVLTVRDAIGDLEAVEVCKNLDQLVNYSVLAKSSFQRESRGSELSTVSEHVCKQVSELSKARIERIPCRPGADWRDLPNLCLTLPDGKVIKRLEYLYPDVRLVDFDGQAIIRGVCGCASGDECNSAESRQESTLVPWCLVHTANKNYQWAGLYGRLHWLGYFATTVTNPEPISKQGMVVHPVKNRILSVRECARSQGFMDSFRFTGKVMDRYRQIGNAVPVPLAKALAIQFRDCLS